MLFSKNGNFLQKVEILNINFQQKMCVQSQIWSNLTKVIENTTVFEEKHIKFKNLTKCCLIFFVAP